jgi:DNA modification methylase
MLRIYKTIPCSNLKVFPHNSRTHSAEQIQQVIESINEFGFTNPLLIDENNMIIAGHCRLEAANKIGMEELPCIVLDGLSEAQKSALVIADNKIAMNAGWDDSILKEQFDFLREHNFDLKFTGFNEEELSLFYPTPLPLALCDDNELPQITDISIVNPGDLWCLGDHRLLCGDSTNALDVERLLNGQMPNTMITDPPYGVKYEGDWRAKARGVKKSIREESSNIKNDDRADWYDAYVLFPGNVAYVWHASVFTDVVMDGLRRAGFNLKQQIIWNKNHFSLGRSDYQWKHEPCWYAIKEGRNWIGDRKQTTVWDVTAINYDNNKADRTSHPTQKPVELYTKPIEHHTNPGEYIYDPFAGSGTLLIAAEKTKRRALMMELDPKYVEVILQRYKNYTGNDPIRDDGVKYSELRG